MKPAKIKNVFGYVDNRMYFIDIFGKETIVNYPLSLYIEYISIFAIWSECERCKAIGWKAYPSDEYKGIKE